jgi:hypothetical protein
MSDIPASWQPDPTGRHDHRYWDGTEWTEHVADAGVASTDHYEAPVAAPSDTGPEGPPAGSTWGPGTAASSTSSSNTERHGAFPSDAAASADPEAAPGAEGSPSGARRESPSAGSTSGWALPDERTPSVSGWGAPVAEDDPSGSTAPDAAEAPGVAGAGWAATTAAWGATERAEDPATGAADQGSPAASGATTWNEPTTILGTGVPAASDVTTAWSGPAEGETAELPTSPVPAPSGEGPEGDRDGRSRKILLVVLALLVIAGIVAALVLLSDDDDGGGSSADEVAERISSALQDDLDMSEGDADCIGRDITQRIGADRLDGVDFESPEAPPQLEQDFNDAFNEALGECAVDVGEVGSDAGAEGEGDAGDTEDGPNLSEDIGDPEEYAALLAESYATTLGISEEKSTCLAERVVQAIDAGDVSADEASGQFFQFLDACEITLEELNPPSG